MKKLIITVALSCCLYTAKTNAQVNTNQPTNNAVSGENAFIDASTNFNDANSLGKGLVFPRTDLTTWEFKTDALDSIIFPTAFDGMIVYNTATGTTLSGQGIVTTVAPGFYYFSNPTGSTNITAGTWKPLGSGTALDVKDITATEVALATKIDGAQLYAIKGTFTASGTSALVTITKPTGMTGYYSFTTYKDGKTFRRDINSFDMVAESENVKTGTGGFTEVYPAGIYNYILEYFK